MSIGLRYDQEADRLFGGDVMQQLQGKYVLNSLLSLRRAKMMYETAKTLYEVYKSLAAGAELSDNPFGMPLAVLEIDKVQVPQGDKVVEYTIEQLFDLPEFGNAPLEYRQLCRIITILPDPVDVDTSPISNDDGYILFARQIMRTLRCAHKKGGVSFSRREGTCLETNNLTSRGEILDIYYLTRGSEVKESLEAFQRFDVNCALFAVWRIIGERDPQLKKAFQAAVLSYCADSRKVDQLVSLSQNVAATIGPLAPDDPQAPAALNTLATALLHS